MSDMADIEWIEPYEGFAYSASPRVRRLPRMRKSITSLAADDRLAFRVMAGQSYDMTHRRMADARMEADDLVAWPTSWGHVTGDKSFGEKQET